MKRDSLGDRMKANYENITRTKLVRRMPVIIRLDGKAFHTLTRKFNKPFDDKMFVSMVNTCVKLQQEVQNCKLIYSQSDEISILLTDYTNLNTDQWFDGNIQKICSVSASIAAVTFSKEINREAYFDARVFNIPKEEVCNYFIWRQQDATRNSIEAIGQANFSHRELHCKSCSDIQEMLFQKGINWNDTPTYYKRGFCIKDYQVDNEIPIFTQDRNYVEGVI